MTALLQIRPGELRKVALVAALFTLIELGRSTGGSGADALFFLRFGVENLPYMFIALGVTNFVFSLSYAAFLGRFNKGRFFITLLLLMAGLLLLAGLALVVYQVVKTMHAPATRPAGRFAPTAFRRRWGRRPSAPATSASS